VAWTCVIFFFSTDVFSSSNTSWFLIHVMRMLHINFVHYDFLNRVMRKCAHFSTYFILSLLFFRAWRATLPDRHPTFANLPISDKARNLLAIAAPEVTLAAYVARVRIEPVWALRWSALTILFSAFIATLDEFHQSFVPSRTGNLRDVALDTMGAFFAQVVLMLIFIDRSRRVRSSS
jgi:VanZ family protein